VEFFEKSVKVNRLLQGLVQKHGEGFSNYVFDAKSGNVKGFLQLLLNGRSIATLDGLDTRLEDGDIVAIIPPVGGG